MTSIDKFNILNVYFLQTENGRIVVQLINRKDGCLVFKSKDSILYVNENSIDFIEKQLELISYSDKELLYYELEDFKPKEFYIKQLLIKETSKLQTKLQDVLIEESDEEYKSDEEREYSVHRILINFKNKILYYNQPTFTTGEDDK